MIFLYLLAAAGPSLFRKDMYPKNCSCPAFHPFAAPFQGLFEVFSLFNIHGVPLNFLVLSVAFLLTDAEALNCLGSQLYSFVISQYIHTDITMCRLH